MATLSYAPKVKMGSPAKKCVELFYDVLSPYSWIGFEVMCRYSQKWNVNLQLKPFLIGGIMAGSENLPPGLNPSKGEHAARDLHRLRQYYQIPLRAPSDFMGTIIQKGSLNAQRLLTASTIDCPSHTEELSRELWMRVWNRDEDITQPDSLLAACVAVGAPDGLLTRIKDQEVKDKLKAHTDEALSYKAFGAPTFVVEGTDKKKHMVFGSDRMHIIAQLLGEQYEGPLNELAKTSLPKL